MRLRWIKERSLVLCWRKGVPLHQVLVIPWEVCVHTLLWWSRCVLCCTIKSNIFCIHAAVGDGQGVKVYWDLLLNMKLPLPGQEGRGWRRLCGSSSSCLPWAPSGCPGGPLLHLGYSITGTFGLVRPFICPCDSQSNISSFSCAALEHKIVKIQLGIESQTGEKVPRDCSE